MVRAARSSRRSQDSMPRGRPRHPSGTSQPTHISNPKCNAVSAGGIRRRIVVMQRVRTETLRRTRTRVIAPYSCTVSTPVRVRETLPYKLRRTVAQSAHPYAYLHCFRVACCWRPQRAWQCLRGQKDVRPLHSARNQLRDGLADAYLVTVPTG